MLGRPAPLPSPPNPSASCCRLTQDDDLPLNQYLPGDHGMFPAPYGERMPADLRIFSLEGKQSARKPLLRNMHNLQKIAKATAEEITDDAESV